MNQNFYTDKADKEELKNTYRTIVQMKVGLDNQYTAKHNAPITNEKERKEYYDLAIKTRKLVNCIENTVFPQLTQFIKNDAQDNEIQSLIVFSDKMLKNAKEMVAKLIEDISQYDSV